MNIFTKIAAGVVIAVASTALQAQAQDVSSEPQHKFVPFTVNEDDANTLTAFLRKQPWEVANPVLQWISRLESQAYADARQKAIEQEKKNADEMKKKPAPSKP